jgi:hypothetical protein
MKGKGQPGMISDPIASGIPDEEFPIPNRSHAISGSTASGAIDTDRRELCTVTDRRMAARQIDCPHRTGSR